MNVLIGLQITWSYLPPIAAKLPSSWCTTEQSTAFHRPCRSSAADLHFGAAPRIIAATTERPRRPRGGLGRGSGRLFSEKPDFAFFSHCAEIACELFVQHSRTAAPDVGDH